MADLKKVLQSIKDQKSNEDLCSHLSKVFSKMLLENPKNGYEFFEDISYDVKFNGYDYRKNEKINKNKENFSEIKEYTAKARNFYEKINTGTEEEPQEPGPCGYVPNFMEEAKWFEWAGTYFGEEQSYKIFKSLTRLSITKQLKQVRFWGKILGSKKDYYIAEGISEDAGEQGELPPLLEPKGSGVNKLNYWVSNDVMGEWIELPIVTPDQIIAARKVRYIFTGNLDANVITNPYFFGKEKNLLKAQIIRISHSTTLIPKGVWKKVEDDPKEIEYNEDEEFKFPSFEILKKMENWSHLSPSILKQGRIIHFKPEFGADANEEEEMKKIEAKDPFENRLKTINEDKSLEGFDYAWNLRVYGDTLSYDTLSFKKTKTSFGIIAIKSMVWPGSLTVLNEQKVASIYVGYGMKASKKLFFSSEPQKILTEPIDSEEQPEPNHPKEVEKSNEDQKEENSE